ncbi:MAG: hypothetical protein VX642_01495 [Bdellovibrionota bacterium]|nr:hypothetical protein [Bdellovibrionota bacterium]
MLNRKNYHTSLFIGLGLIFFLKANLAWSMLPFYKQLDSEYPSGSSSKRNLIQKRIDNFIERSFEIAHRGTHYWVKEDESLSYHKLAISLKCKTKSALYSSRNTEESPKNFCKPEENLMVIGYQNGRFRVRNHLKKVYWVDEKDTYWPFEEMGFAFFPEASYINQVNSGAKVWVNKMQRIEISHYLKNKVVLNFSGKSYWVGFDKVISPLHLASHLRLSNQKWQSFELKENKIFFSNSSHSLPKKPILNFNSAKMYIHKNQALYLRIENQLKNVSKTEQSFLANSIREKENFWHISKIKGHGNVYWQDNPFFAKHANSILSSELFKREIFDMASSPVAKDVLFASAGGIFRKETDNEWIKLDFFGEQNLPIHFSKSGRLFVGAHYSDDMGKSFTPYLSLKDIVLKNKQSKLESFKILEIKTKDDNGKKISLHIKQGKKDYWMNFELN